MSELYAKVSDSELKIMKILWQEAKPMKLAEIRKKITPITGWESVMVKTLLYRLVDKGVVSSKKQDAFYFTPNISEQDYNEYATNSFVEKLYDGNVKNLVATLIDANKISEEDISELRAMFKVGKGKVGN